jgi:hypothetical protein
MPKRSVDPPGQWGRANSEEVKRPKRQSRLDALLEYLEPFSDGPGAEFDGKRYLYPRDVAIEMIEDAARTFNLMDYLARGAPRFQNVLKNLKNIQILAEALAIQLESLDDMTRHELKYASAKIDASDRECFKVLMDVADVKALPSPSNDAQVGDEGPQFFSWVERLQGLSKYLSEASKNLVLQRQKQKRNAQDEGGNTNYWKETFGSPRRALVHDALQIFEDFNPGMARGTIFGQFHNFVLCLYEYATGKDGVECAKMDDWVKTLVPACRKEMAVYTLGSNLEAEGNEILKFDPTLKSEYNRQRIAEVLEELKEIQTELEGIRRIIYPHQRARNKMHGRQFTERLEEEISGARHTGPQGP